LDSRFSERMPRIEGAGAIAVVIIVIIGGVLIFSVGRVGVGYVAVVVDPVFGTTTSVGEGANARYFFKPPWAGTFNVYVATDSVNMWTERGAIGDFPSVPSLTKDGLRVDVDITVRWRVSPSGVVDLFRRFPALDWKERTIIPIIREAIRNLLVDFTAIETIERRGIIDTMMEQALSEAFTREPSLAGAVLIDAVDLRRISLPDNFVNAIESKAEGIAKSRIIVANASREAIDTIAMGQPGLNSTQLTNLYLYLETLRSIAESGKGSFIVAPGDMGQFIIPIPP